MELDELLKVYSKLGFKKLEVFTHWVRSAFNYFIDPVFYIEMGKKYNMKFKSFHLPDIGDDTETSLENAVMAARFAKAIGVSIVIFKAASRENYIKTATRFLDVISDLNLITVITNHKGTAISTINDYKQVIDGINDNRMKTLLEVGHFHSVGVSWEEGYDLLGESIALIHLKDMRGLQSVPFGTGEIDIKGLFHHMKARGYNGDYVIEMEVNDRGNTIKYLEEALDYVKSIGVM